MSRYGVRTLWMLLFGLLLLPTGFAMATRRFGLAGVCVVVLIAVRLFGLPNQPLEDEGADDTHGD